MIAIAWETTCDQCADMLCFDGATTLNAVREELDKCGWEIAPDLSVECVRCVAKRKKEAS